MRPYWSPSLETLDRQGILDLQDQRLRQTVRQAAKSPHYAQALAEAGVDPATFGGLADLRRLPLTTKDDLRAGFPYRFLAVPRAQVVRMHASSGTTGQPTAVYHSKTDLKIWADLMARCLFMAGLRPGDVFQNMTGYGLFTGGLGMHYGAERLGAMVIPAGAGNSHRQISLMRQFGTTSLHIIPSYALKLLETFKELGLSPKRDTKLKLFMIGAEPHTEEARRRIEEAYGIKAYNSYGLSEMNGPGVAFECSEQNGLHLWEDAFLLEVLDPDTLEPVQPGQVGELVMTTLTRTAMPVLRYRTRDLSRVLTGDCACGRHHVRLDRLSGRSDDMFIIKGVNIYPMQIESVLMSLAEVGHNYLIQLSKKGDQDQLLIKVELAEAHRTKDQAWMERLNAKLVRSFRDEILVTPRVELAAPGSLPSGEGKAQRVLDLRQGA